MLNKNKTNLPISTPQRPSSLPPVELTENAYSVFIRRYARRNLSGEPIEEVEDTFWRVAYHVAAAGAEWNESGEETAEDVMNQVAAMHGDDAEDAAKDGGDGSEEKESALDKPLDLENI